MSAIIEKLKELHITLPKPPKAAGAYVPVVTVSSLAFTSGVLPFGEDGSLEYTQQIDSSNIENGQAAALCALKNALSLLNENLGGLDNIERIVRMVVYVNSQAGFCQQPLVANPVSELLVKIWGEKGKHVRTAIGVSELPFGASVELELLVQIQTQ